MLKIALAVAGFAFWLFCVVDVITTPDGRQRHLPKTVWLLIVLFFPFVGSVAWLLVGRDRTEAPLTRSQGAAPGYPEYERRGRMAAQDPSKDEDFLREVRARAEEQRAKYAAEQRRKREAEEQQKRETEEQ